MKSWMTLGCEKNTFRVIREIRGQFFSTFGHLPSSFPRTGSRSARGSLLIELFGLGHLLGVQRSESCNGWIQPEPTPVANNSKFPVDRLGHRVNAVLALASSEFAAEPPVAGIP